MDEWRTSKADQFGLHIVIFYAKAGINYWAELRRALSVAWPKNIDPVIDLSAAATLLCWLQLMRKIKQNPTEL